MATARTYVLLLAILSAATDVAADPSVMLGGGQFTDQQPQIIYIADHTPTSLSGPVSWRYSQSGTVFQACAVAKLSSGPPDYITTAWTLPLLPAGNYTFRYATAFNGAKCTPGFDRPFTVIPSTFAGGRLVEYYNASLDHYFQTADPTEQSVLDQEIIAGWARTGVVTTSYSTASPESPDLAPVCRFYGRPEAGLNTHFYSALPSDCAIVLEAWPDDWILESDNAFEVVPATAEGGCPTPLHGVVRFYNNQPSPNHRYLMANNTNAIQDMLTRGWLEEGVAWCAAAG